jgi:hypothetical protein
VKDVLETAILFGREPQATADAFAYVERCLQGKVLRVLKGVMTIGPASKM